MFLIYLSTLLATVLALAYYYIYRAYTYWQRKGIHDQSVQGPTFPFGHFGPTFLQKFTFGEVVQQIYNARRVSSEKIIAIYTGFRPTVIVCDPELVQKVFIKDFPSFHDRGVYINEKTDPLSGHLFSLGGEKWRNLRTKLTPTFTSGKLKAMFTTLLDVGDTLQVHMDKVVVANNQNSNEIDVRELLAQYTTNIIASVAFGIQVDCIGDPTAPFRKYGRKFFETTFRNGLRIGLSVLFPTIFRYFNMKTVDQDLEDFMISVVKENLSLRENENISRKDFFQLLVQLRNTGKVGNDNDWETKIQKNENDKILTINEVAAQTFVFFIAGFETSSSTMSFALYELAKNPECQQKCHTEIDRVLAKYNNQITYENVLEMPYLEQCIDETLRMYPPLQNLTRECTKPWQVPNTDIIIEKGTLILLPAYAMQMDERFYPQPLIFRPERFSSTNNNNNENEQQQHDDFHDQHNKSFIEKPYMPFGEGPRYCVGSRFGKMQTKVGLILMLKNYSYELSGNTKKPLIFSPNSFVTTAKGGIQLKVTKRIK